MAARARRLPSRSTAASGRTAQAPQPPCSCSGKLLALAARSYGDPHMRQPGAYSQRQLKTNQLAAARWSVFGRRQQSGGRWSVIREPSGRGDRGEHGCTPMWRCWCDGPVSSSRPRQACRHRRPLVLRRPVRSQRPGHRRPADPQIPRHLTLRHPVRHPPAHQKPCCVRTAGCRCSPDCGVTGRLASGRSGMPDETLCAKVTSWW